MNAEHANKETLIEVVNLFTPPQSPGGFIVDPILLRHRSEGQIIVIKDGGGELYVDRPRGKKKLVILHHLTNPGSLKEIEQLDVKRLLSGNFARFLINHQNFVPESWKSDHKLNTIRHIHFLGTIWGFKGVDDIQDGKVECIDWVSRRSGHAKDEWVSKYSDLAIGGFSTPIAMLEP